MQKEKAKKGGSSTSPAEYLAFEDICPTWASKLRTGLDNQDLKILAHDSKYCIVGEAWGYTGRQTGYYIAPLIPFVGCWTCVKFGRAMGKIASQYSQSFSAVGHLQPIISRFVEHWNEKHSDSIYRYSLARFEK
jgi:hypothetical protein